MAAPKYQIILYSDTPVEAKAIRDAQEVKTVIRDALVFDGVPEPAEAIAFWGATNRQAIVDAYASVGVTRVYDIPFEIAEPDFLDETGSTAEPPVIVQASVATSEPTALDAQIEAMSDEELRDNLEKLTGAKPHHAKKRDTLIADLKAALS